MTPQIDLTGKRFGKLTIIAASYKNKRASWLCRCDCGKEKIILEASLKRDITKSCGCTTGRFVDETGKRYGRLVVIGYNNKKDRPHGASWICKCDCGNETIVRGGTLRSEKSNSCGCLRLERAFESNSFSIGEASRNKAIANMKRNAKRRNIQWNLTDDETVCLIQNKCHYCGSLPSNTSCVSVNTGNYVYSGIDRVDNSKGYTIENVVPCCIICNNAKHTLSLKDFLDWIKQVYQHSIISD